MIDPRQIRDQLRFSGFKNVEFIADNQSGPTCGFEAIENIIQLFHQVGNDLVERDLLQRAIQYGVARPENKGYSLSFIGYQRILGDYGITAQWYPFDPMHVVLPALRSNLGVLVVGDAHYLNHNTYPSPNSWHSFVLTNYYTDWSVSDVLGYVGIDSNFALQEMFWPRESVERSAILAAQHYQMHPVLITDHPGNLRQTASYYRTMPNGEIAPAD